MSRSQLGYNRIILSVSEYNYTGMEGQAAQSKMNESAQNEKGGNQATAGTLPENSSQINVSVKKNPNFYVFLGKRYLEIHETIELHALGNAVSTSVIASENLVR